MNSTLTSNEVLDVDNITISYHLKYHEQSSLRDSFIGIVKNPFQAILKGDEYINITKELSFKVNKGERVALIGANGAGKTSICRAIAGMFAPQIGKIRVKGEIRAIFDTAIGVYPELTGRENGEILVKLMYPRLTKDEMEEVLRDALEFSELGHFLDTPFKSYSKGMQTRLTLSIISAKPCDLLILDEVFEGADSFFQEKIAKRVLKMIEESGAVIFVSHSPAQINKACNRALVLNAGEIVYDGEVQGGIDHYNNLGPIFGKN